MMCFVYYLSYKGVPFYIGSSKNLLKRYITHYKSSDTTPFNYIKTILRETGEYVDVIPITYCEELTARLIEKQLIKECDDVEIKLTNMIGNGDRGMIFDWVKENYTLKFTFPTNLIAKIIEIENNCKLKPPEFLGNAANVFRDYLKDKG